MQITATDPYQAVREELATLRHQVTGVTGCLIAGVDGLLILHDTHSATEPHDIAAMAAAAHGISRTYGTALGQGRFHEVTIHNDGGYLTVYPAGELTLLAVTATDGLNIARLHIQARPAITRLAALLTPAPAHP